MTKLSEIRIRKIFKEAGRPLTIEEIADRLGYSIRHTRRLLRKVSEKGLLIEKRYGNKIYYEYLDKATLDRFLTGENTRELSMPLTKIEEIGRSLREIAEKYHDTIIKVKKAFHDLSPYEILESTISYLEYLEKSISKSKSEEREKELNKIRHQKDVISHIRDFKYILGDIIRINDIGDPFKRSEVVIAGSDASVDHATFLWYLGNFPLTIDLSFITVAGIVVAYDSSFEKELEYYKEYKEPKFPLSAGSSYIEELSGRYPSLDENEKRKLLTIQSSELLFNFNLNLLTSENIDILFCDGRIIPPDIHFMDFYYEHRRPYLKRSFLKAREIRKYVRETGKLYVGVVKEAYWYDYMALMAQAILFEIMGSNVNMNMIRRIFPNDQETMAKILDSGEASFAIKVPLRKRYLKDKKDEKTAKRVLEEADVNMNWYIKSLDDMSFYYFYSKPPGRLHSFSSLSRPARYDIDAEDARGVLDARNKVCYIISKIASAPLGHQYSPSRETIYLPTVVWQADRAAREWVNTVKTQIFHYLRSTLAKGGRL